MSRSSHPARPVAGVIVGESPLRIWGLTSDQRLRRQLARAGAREVTDQAQRLVMLRADWVYDDALVRGLAEAPDDVALTAVDGRVVALGVAAPAPADRKSVV